MTASKLEPKFKRIGDLRREPFSALHDSPTQPRTTYDEAYINELAENIKANGDILQPLMIRKFLPPGEVQWREEFGYEVIFGHCRKRGGLISGLADAPVQEVDMTDEQVILAQLSENITRDDLHFVDVAEGIAKLRRDFNVSVPELIKKTGICRTNVYGMTKLADACDAVKQACRDGKIDQELAIIVARIPSHKLQALALKDAEEQARQNSGEGYRKTRRILLDKYSLYLKDALFSLDDALLVPSAGACTTCPNRSGASPELFGDVLKKRDYYSATKHGKDVCMDPDCFNAKKKAQLDLDARELASKGKVVVTGNAARQALTAHGEVKGAYVAVSEVRAVLKNVKGAERPQTVLIQDQRSGKTVEAIKRSDLTGTGASVPDKAQSQQAKLDKQREDNLRLEREAEIETNHRHALCRDLMDKMRKTPRTLFDLRAAAVRMLDVCEDHHEWELVCSVNGFKSLHELENAIGLMSPDDIAMVMMSISVARDVSVAYWEMGDGDKTALHAMATHHGIDIAQHRADFEAANGLSTPSPAAQARKGGSKKATKAPSAQTQTAAAPRPAAQAHDKGGRDPHDDKTLALPLDEPESQSASPKGDGSTHHPQYSPDTHWPFPKPRPSASEQMDDTAKPSLKTKALIATEGDA